MSLDLHSMTLQRTSYEGIYSPVQTYRTAELGSSTQLTVVAIFLVPSPKSNLQYAKSNQ